jgi:hypothetical protein
MITPIVAASAFKGVETDNEITNRQTHESSLPQKDRVISEAPCVLVRKYIRLL